MTSSYAGIDPTLLRTAHDISPEFHVRMQAAFQAHVDNAVSKTVNFPSTATREDVKKVFELAYELKCKGVTIYRDKSRDNQILQKTPIQVPDIGNVNLTSDPVPITTDRPPILHGHTFKINTGCGSIYVTINEDQSGPRELFATIGKAGGCADSQSQAIGRMVSMAWRNGITAQEVLRQLSDISCHAHCGLGDKKVKSCADAVSKAIRQYLELKNEEPNTPAPDPPKTKVHGACPDCGGMVEHEGGCEVCHSCGYSKCG
jgi:ribonucleoside-diphosphate reductase alpha chain